jgi:hypothetical protein
MAVPHTRPSYKKDEMAISLQPTRRKSSLGLELLENNENLLLSEETHFVETYCQILEINIKEKVVLIVATAVDGRTLHGQ